MAATTFTATTAEGTTVVRTSPTMAYTHVVLVQGPEGEGDYRWSQSAQAAQQCATGLINKGRSARVVPVEQTLRGKAAKAAIEAAKNGTTEAVVAAQVAPSEPQAGGEATEGATTRRTRTKAAQAATAEVDPAAEERARVEALATAEFAALINDLTEAQEKVARLLARRNGMIDNLLTQQIVSGPKLAKVMGVTPMAVYNMRAKAVR